MRTLKLIPSALVLAVLASAGPVAGTTGAITLFPLPTRGAGPVSIVTGPDGNLWFTQIVANRIGRLTPGGVLTEFTIPTPNGQPDEIDVGPDAALWFAEILGNKIGRITTAGVITEYVVPTAGSRPTVVAPGPDGNVWFTERGTVANPGNKVGRVVLETGVVEEFALPTDTYVFNDLNSPDPGRRPLGIVAGPDGGMWFTEERYNQIGRIDAFDPSGPDAIREYKLPNFEVRRQPFEITLGPDGAMWFTEGAGSVGNRIGRITTDGVITEFAVPTPASGPNTIRRGPDPHAAKYCRYEQDAMTDEAFTTRYGTFGLCVAEVATTDTLWFTEFNGNRIARITTKGVIDEFVLPLPAGAPTNATTGPIGITEGPDGAVWFAENAAIGNAIGRLDVDLYGQPAAPASAPSVALDASGAELLELP